MLSGTVSAEKEVFKYSTGNMTWTRLNVTGTAPTATWYTGSLTTVEQDIYFFGDPGETG